MDSSIIEDIVKWRMGAAYDAPILDWRDKDLNFDAPGQLNAGRAGCVSMDRGGFEIHCPPGRSPYNPSIHPRLVQAVEDMFNLWRERGGSLAVFLAMNDVRLFPSVEYMGPRTDAKCVQLSFARPVLPRWRTRAEVILWPLSDQIRPWRMPTTRLTPWKERRPELIWRGQASGISYELGESAKPVLTGIRQIPKWVNGWLLEEASTSAETFWSGYANYQRLLAVARCRDLPGADVRLVPLWDGDKRAIEVAARYLGPQILAERSNQAAHFAERQNVKYALTLAGNGFPSSLRQDLLSGCVVLMPQPFWECTWFFGLQPNIHYLPLRADLADLEERLEWCRNNDESCRQIAENALAFGQEHFPPAVEEEILSRTLDRLIRQVALGATP